MSVARPIRLSAPLAAALVAVTTLLPAADRDHSLRSTYPAQPGKRVVVDGGSLDVHVRGADVTMIEAVTELHISGVSEERADQWVARHTPIVSDAPDLLSVTHQAGRDPFMWFGHLTARAQLAFVVPTSTVPDLTTLSGAISVRGDFAAAQPLRLRTSSGAIEVSGAVHSIELHTTSGDAHLDLVRPTEKLFARSSSGSVSMIGGAKTVRIDTAAGDVWLSKLSGSVAVVTSSGKVTLRWDRLDPDQTVDVKTASGAVDLVVPAGCRPRGTLTTVSGTIRSQFPGRVTDPGDSVILTGDGPRFTVESASGVVLLSQAGE